jgi:hypothetical protein
MKNRGDHFDREANFKIKSADKCWEFAVKSPAQYLLYTGCSKKEEVSMLFTIAIILLILWLLGFVSSYTLGGYLYILLVIALILFVVGLFQRRGRRL